ncbi:MAG: hypothetical protein AAF432_05780 [Planctomycetota bacterium]
MHVNARPLVVCPLEHEARLLRAAGVHDVADVRVIGCSADRVVSTMNALPDSPRLIILAGVAGALTTLHAPGSAVVISQVVDAATSTTWTPTHCGDADVTVTSSSHIIHGAERSACAAHTGAHVVDMESVSFARAMIARGFSWAIVRGISDGPTAEFQVDVTNWTRDNGHVRTGRVIRDLAMHPGSWRAIRRLARTTKKAMHNVAVSIERLIDDAKIERAKKSPDHP